MKKKILEALPLLRVPTNIQVASLPFDVKIGYIYTAVTANVDQKTILEVDFYSLAVNEVVFRSFFADNDFISQISTGPCVKWSEAMLENIIPYNLQCVPANKQSDRVIKKFLKNKVTYDKKGIINDLALFQAAIRAKQLIVRHDKVKARIDSVFSGIENIPENMEAWINEYPLRDSQYIFYHTVGKKKYGYCSVCKNETVVYGVKHKQKGVCPICGHPVTFKAEGISHNTQDYFVFTMLQKSLDGGLISRVFEGFKSYPCGFKEPKLVYDEKRRYVCNGDSVTAYHYGNFMNTNERRWCDGSPNTFFYRYITDEGCLYFANLREVLRSTIWLDSGIELLAFHKYQFDAVDYLLLYNKQKGIQYLAANGLYSLIIESLSNPYKLPSLNENLFTIIRSNKFFFPMFREIGILSDELLVFDACKIGTIISRAELLRIREWDTMHDFIGLLKYTSASKAVNYIERQISNTVSAKQTVISWLDYIDMCTFLEYNLSSSLVLFPKNLKREHDRVLEEKRSLQDFIYDERIKAMSLPLDRYFAYSDKQFFIRAPKDSCEIRNEGAALRHCVDRYLDSVAKKETVILFIRQISEPDKPYYTVEYNNNKIRQCHGYCNANATDEINKFLNKWLNAVVSRGGIPSEIAANS